MKYHIVQEHDWIIEGHQTGWQGQFFYLNPTDFQAFSSLLTEPTLTPFGPEYLDVVAKLTHHQGQPAFKLQQWVGALRLPSGTTLDILPKTHQHGHSVEASRDMLLRMLSVTNERFRIAPPNMLNLAQMPLFEIVLAYALAGMRAAMRRGLPHTYLAVQEERPSLRGKLLMTQQLRQPPHRAHLLHVEYDEFIPNRPETRLLRRAIEQIKQLSQQPSTIRLANHALNTLEQVPASQNIKADFTEWRLERGYHHFEAVKPLCQMILYQLNPLASGQQVGAMSLLFDMNRVYESYVAWLLKKQHPRWQIQTQVNSQYLGHTAGRKVFNLRPDLLITLENGEIIVADTKWKKLQANKAHYGISPTDIYQMLAYSQVFQQKKPAVRIWLMYPHMGNLPEHLPPIYLPQQQQLELIQVNLATQEF